MSEDILRRATELAWRHWTMFGVSGVAPSPAHALDLEALIAFTPFVAVADPRLADEAFDWCVGAGRHFVSVSRLRQIVRLMPERMTKSGVELPAFLLGTRTATRVRLSRKGRDPTLAHPTLLQLRSRFIFGIGARADVLARLAMIGRTNEDLGASSIRPSGYTKQAISTVLDELAQAGVLSKVARGRSVGYRVVKEAPLRALLAPLPRKAPNWTERFVIIATILEAWVRYGTRATYAVELVKLIDTVLRAARSLPDRPRLTGRSNDITAEVDRWASTLLDDEAWYESWILGGEDLAQDILAKLADDLIAAIQSDDYPVGYTELDQLAFRNHDLRGGTVDFRVEFSGEHPREDFSFAGHVEGTLTFAPTARKKTTLLDSIEIVNARPHFDMGEPDDG